ncbi:hypothetical protein OKA05_18820 [Luteolibacter arcticus]|uniref:Uncharacterized protein n=1 Tax=Luteolibacter arcticus TaxID=1581411 RepID=A0ABT3GM72_9BACT|nr:hypothetical protein [Luteolibacter arcticus]MCW1924625.1 hypothetical protein [Luteolibacter arcticus]
MKSKTLLAALSGVLALVFPLSSLAQGEAQVSMKIDLVAWGDSISGLTLKSGKGRDPVTALAFRYSTPVNYSGPTLLEIHQGTAPAATAEAEPAAAVPAAATANNLAAILAERRKKTPSLVSLALLPATSSHTTVLLAPAASGTFQAYVINDDPSKLPYGQLRIHNLSPLTIAMRCNNKAGKELKTKESFVVTPQNKEVIYELAYQSEGEWTTQENNIASVAETEQAQLVVLKSDASFFTSQDGSRAGFLQTVILRRDRNSAGAAPEISEVEKAALSERLKAQEEEMERNAGAKPKPTPKK